MSEIMLETISDAQMQIIANKGVELINGIEDEEARLAIAALIKSVFTSLKSHQQFIEEHANEINEIKNRASSLAKATLEVNDHVATLAKILETRLA